MKNLRIVIAWALVAVPLMYGISQTLIKVTALFAG